MYGEVPPVTTPSSSCPEIFLVPPGTFFCLGYDPGRGLILFFQNPLPSSRAVDTPGAGLFHRDRLLTDISLAERAPANQAPFRPLASPGTILLNVLPRAVPPHHIAPPRQIFSLFRPLRPVNWVRRSRFGPLACLLTWHISVCWVKFKPSPLS